MLIVPELQAVFVFPPRTGSDSLCVQLMAKFPNAFLLYRHMEADGLPAGYDAWRRVGFVRHPLARLWSLFKYCSVMGDLDAHPALESEIQRIVASVQGKSFEQWVLTNEQPFLPKDSGIPVLHQLHNIPENRKSLEMYLRPDLGTVILKFQDLAQHMEAWGLDPSRRNGATPAMPLPKPSKKLKKHLEKYFGWELAMNLEVV
jgi:hypothetical protein